MAGVHFKSKLIHTCTIERATHTRDAIGGVIPESQFAGSWAVSSSAVACRYVEKREQKSSENTGFPTEYEHMLLFNTGVDLLITDRISNIALSGTALGVGTFAIERVLQRNTGANHHISVRLELVE